MPLHHIDVTDREPGVCGLMAGLFLILISIFIVFEGIQRMYVQEARFRAVGAVDRAG